MPKRHNKNMTIELKSYVFKTKIKNQWLSEQTFAQLDFWPTTWNSPCDNLPHPVLLMWCPWTLNLWPPVVALDINGPSSPEFMTRNPKQQDVAEAVVQLQQGSKWTQQCHCCFRSTQTPSFLSMNISYKRHNHWAANRWALPINQASGDRAVAKVTHLSYIFT